VAQVRRASAATPCRTVSGARSIKAVFSRPEKPNPRPRDLKSCACSQAHHMRDPHQLAPPGAFFHLPIDQASLHLPLACFPPKAPHLEPLSKMGREGREVHI
jgi:hypothetical protein